MLAQGRFNFSFWNFLDFFPNIFGLWLVNLEETRPMDMEAQLYLVCNIKLCYSLFWFLVNFKVIVKVKNDSANNSIDVSSLSFVSRSKTNLSYLKKKQKFHRKNNSLHNRSILRWRRNCSKKRIWCSGNRRNREYKSR